MKKVIFLAFLAASWLACPPPSIAQMSQAQIAAAIYGTLLGNADACGLTIKRWHAEAMGRQISRLALDDDDRELAIGLARSMEADTRKSPTMTCDEVRASLKQSEDEIR